MHRTMNIHGIHDAKGSPGGWKKGPQAAENVFLMTWKWRFESFE